MVAKNRVFHYRYMADAKDSRSAEYVFVKYFLALLVVAYLVSSVWIFVFIFQQADWERNAHQDDAITVAGITTWTWWTVAFVILADLVASTLLYVAVWCENLSLIMTLSVLAYIFSLFGILNRYLRGSIVCFVFPFACATVSLVQYFMQRNEDHEHELTKGLRLRDGPPPTMETFLDEHEQQIESL